MNLHASFIGGGNMGGALVRGLLARGLPGDGHIDFRTLGAAVADAGYRGDVEVEVFHADVWAAPFDEVVTEVVRRYHSHVAL
jgi:sugar phosphate isomerase/epimerase